MQIRGVLDKRARFLLAVALLLVLMTGPFLLAALTIWLDADVIEQGLLQRVILPHLPTGTFLTVLAFGAGVALIYRLFKDYVVGLQRMAEHLGLLLEANRHFKISTEGPPEFKALAEAANALALQRNALIEDVEAQIQAANVRMETERSRLSALVSDLPQAVLVCNRQGRILLYNAQATAQLCGPSLAQSGRHASIGLGRSVYTLLERPQIDHAIEVIEHRLSVTQNAPPRTVFVARSPTEALLRVQMVAVLAPASPESMAETPSLDGYVLSIENITQSFEQENLRDKSFSDLIANIRGGLAPIRALHHALPAEQGQEIGLAMTHLGSLLDDGMTAFSRMLKFRWPLDEMVAYDILTTAQRRIQENLKLVCHLDESHDVFWIKADSYHLVFALQFLASRIEMASDVRSVHLRQSGNETSVFLDLVWQGAMVSSETALTWELDAMSFSDKTSPLSLREVLQRQHAEIRYEREKVRHEGSFRMVFPRLSPSLSSDVLARQRDEQAGRPEYYDFDLFGTRALGDFLDCSLQELVYTVFDTETTGLEPRQGDEIIQIGALRVSNGRLRSQEVFEQLVNPGFSLPPAGIPIHGIRDEMLLGKPSIGEVLPAFHEFAADTVLVAHNAAFDMRFLQIKEASTGLRFGQPVLDTLLLSAVIHPGQESHSLDAIAERLGVPVTARHNALEDAWVTASVFIKLLPLLADMGIVTLRQALEAAQKTYFARITY